MRYPDAVPIYRHCLMCGRPFRVWRWGLLRNRGKFCTKRCYFTSLRAFSKALADGRLELILAPERIAQAEAGRRHPAAATTIGSSET
jgi:hypothetical protein